MQTPHSRALHRVLTFLEDKLKQAQIHHRGCSVFVGGRFELRLIFLKPPHSR